MIVNATRGFVLASHQTVTRNPWQRMKGLLGRSCLAQGEALVITQCQSIHMFFMSFAIDVIFCDATHHVVGLCAGIKPFRVSPLFFKASYAIELPMGSIARSKTVLGDSLDIQLHTAVA